MIVLQKIIERQLEEFRRLKVHFFTMCLLQGTDDEDDRTVLLSLAALARPRLLQVSSS